MQKIIDFIIELDKLKGVTRQSRPIGLTRAENSAEHSRQITMLATSLEPYAPNPIDINHVIAMLLVHDIGEIDTGDTIVYAIGGWEERKASELVAVKRIFGILDATQAEKFLALWQEFEENITDEARFANAADRAMPVLLNLANNGQSWVENGISHKRVINRIQAQIQTGCPALWEHLEIRLENARRNGWFGIKND